VLLLSSLQFAHAAAHLMDGSSEGRFAVTYAPGHVSKAEIESVEFRNADLGAMTESHSQQRLHEKMNTLPDGENVFFVTSPSTGLWVAREVMLRRSL
jgi:hypothetical protein